jgi:PadR family transcriptional regulator PadR
MLPSCREWNIPDITSVIPAEQPMSHTTLSLMQGTVDLLILKALQNGPGHGYTVSRFVRERTDGVLQMEDAALYQALHRLEDKGWIASEWGLSENNRRAKYYSLTAAGKRQLREEVTAFTRYAAAIFKVIET